MLYTLVNSCMGSAPFRQDECIGAIIIFKLDFFCHGSIKLVLGTLLLQQIQRSVGNINTVERVMHQRMDGIMLIFPAERIFTSLSR